jgi:trk system potassium uptake protein TrkH
MSAITTTGSTVFVGLDQMPPGILLWRHIMQGLGGIGIIVVAMAILPLLRIGGMQLFRTESSDRSDKALPRARQVATSIVGVYVFLITACFICLWLAGMSSFDAICHALSSLATGGFSTHDASISYFNSPQIEGVLMFFMICGALPFVLYVQALHGRPLAIFTDSQVHWFLTTTAISILLMAYWVSETQSYDFITSLRYAAFNIISIITTTGFATSDYNQWGSLAVTFFFLLTVVGGCTGSTTGGIKIFRYQILYQVAKAQVQHLIHPHGIFRARFNNKPVAESASNSVLGFFILFAMCFQFITIALSFTGLDFITSMSAAATALANVGPGLGSVIGPSGNFVSLSDPAKWVLSFAMLIGRLELFTVLILFSPQFWKE